MDALRFSCIAIAVCGQFSAGDWGSPFTAGWHAVTCVVLLVLAIAELCRIGAEHEAMIKEQPTDQPAEGV